LSLGLFALAQTTCYGNDVLAAAKPKDKSGPAATTVVVYPAPGGSPVSADYAVTVEGKDSAVYGVPSKYQTPVCFTYFDTTGPVTIDVTVKFSSGDKIADVSVHPLALGIAATRHGDRVTFKAPGPGNITLVVNGDYRNRPLHLFIHPPAEAPPKNAIFFGPGKHVLGYDNPITLTNGQTLCIAGGAWVATAWRRTASRVSNETSAPTCMLPTWMSPLPVCTGPVTGP
jgi:hypothetical protein